MFGFLIVGNVVDNLNTPKYWAIYLQLLLGVSFIVTGGIVSIVLEDRNRAGIFLFYMGNLSQVLAAGTILINLLQVFNWFPQRIICSMMAVYFSAEFLGYMTPVPSILYEYNAAQPGFYYAAGTLFLAFSVADYFFFTYNPLQKNIFVDHSYSHFIADAPSSSSDR